MCVCVCVCEVSGTEMKNNQPKQNSPSTFPYIRLCLTFRRAWHFQLTTRGKEMRPPFRLGGISNIDPHPLEVLSEACCSNNQTTSSPLTGSLALWALKQGSFQHNRGLCVDCHNNDTWLCKAHLIALWRLLSKALPGQTVL